MKKNDVIMFAIGLLIGAVIIGVAYFNMPKSAPEEERPDIMTAYGTVEQRGELYGIWDKQGFTAVDPEEFQIGDRVLVTIYFNPNNNIPDDVVKIVREKVE